jgi:hypothetical protein
MAAHRPACFVRRVLDLAQIVGHLTDRTLFYRPSRYARPPLPAALGCRGIGRLLCREGWPPGRTSPMSISRTSRARRSAAKLLTRDERGRLVLMIKGSAKQELHAQQQGKGAKGIQVS